MPFLSACQLKEALTRTAMNNSYIVRQVHSSSSGNRCSPQASGMRRPCGCRWFFGRSKWQPRSSQYILSFFSSALQEVTEYALPENTVIPIVGFADEIPCQNLSFHLEDGKICLYNAWWVCKSHPLIYEWVLTIYAFLHRSGMECLAICTPSLSVLWKKHDSIWISNQNAQ